MMSPSNASTRLFRLPRAARFTCILALLSCAAACTSTASSGPPQPDREITPIGDLVERSKKPDSIGKLLSDLNNDIRAWNNYFLAAKTDEEKARGRLMETHITTLAHQRRSEIIQELETGPLNNRIVAAAALGFTHDVEAQSPLIAALDDRDDEVVSNALYGLWILGRSDTPADRVCPLLADSHDIGVRTQASLLLMSLTASGSKDTCIARAARLHLNDASPAVRVHCALILANIADTSSEQAIIDLLLDPEALVVAAAARALTVMSANDAHAKGPAARALVKAWVVAKEPAKSSLQRALIEMAQKNYGSDEKEWAKWAERLP